MPEGYIKLYRKIVDHQLWRDKPFSKGQAWVDLLLMANYKDSKFLVGNELVSAEAGQIITSEVKLSERWGWSRHKVRDFINMLEKDKMLVKISDSKRTCLTLCNYSDYQDSDDSKRTASGQEMGQIKDSPEPLQILEISHTSKQQKDRGKDTNNNYIDISNNKDLSIQEDISTLNNKLTNTSEKNKPIFGNNSKPYKCAVFLDREICSRLPAKKPASEKILQSWADAFDKLNRIDGYKWSLIGEALEFSQSDKFWQKNILSGATFRKQFLKIYAKMGGEKDD